MTPITTSCMARRMAPAATGRQQPLAAQPDHLRAKLRRSLRTRQKFGSEREQGRGPGFGRLDGERHHHVLQRPSLLANHRQLRTGGCKPSAGPNNRPVMGSGSVYPSHARTAINGSTGCPDQDCTSGPYVFPANNTFGNYPINTLIRPAFHQRGLLGQEGLPDHGTRFVRAPYGFEKLLQPYEPGRPERRCHGSQCRPDHHIAFGGANGVGMRTLQLSGNIKF